MPVPEQLGSFYLGRTVDEDGSVTDRPLLYDARDLTTHAVCVGMTGSGKTGLCLSLLEEAALDGVPALAVDPKGDLGNLLLTFPELRAEDFRPWIDEAEASRVGKDPDDFAAAVAERWRSGLASWDQDGDRIARMREATELALYTPGSTAGAPLSVLRTLSAPAPATLHDEDAFRERVISTVSGLLSLLGRDADPVSSTDHILLSRILEDAWRAGEHVDLPAFIRRVQEPPFQQLGVMALDSVVSPRERTALAMALNNLLASPTFAPWMEGSPLDVERLLWTPEGRPRISVLSIAHLSDAERMFFLTLFLNEVVTWVRRQPGTGSLRALLYIDEVFGMLPPVAEPPSKRPLLTLLKQARAFGVGVVLATQNPVDLDYKALSNAGTWFLGRLQTERDKARVMEGLRSAGGAGAGLEPSEMDRLLSGLRSRVFLMQNVHEEGPVLFHTRWAMSYLRGPLTRSQLRELATGVDETEAVGEAEAPVGTPAAAGADAAASSPAGAEPPPPVLPSEARESHLPAAAPPRAGAHLVHRAALLGRVRMHFGDRRGLDHWEERGRLVYLADVLGGAGSRGSIADPWDAARPAPEGAQLRPGPPAEGERLGPPPEAARADAWKEWADALEAYAYREERLVRWRAPSLDLRSEPGGDRAAFRARAVQTLRETRDRKVAGLRDRYANRLRAAEDRVRRAEEKVRREESQLGQQKMQTAISAGSAILGAFLGSRGRRGLGRTTTAFRGAGRIAREREDVVRAEEGVEQARQRLQELMDDVQRTIEELQGELDPAALELEEERVRPRKSDLEVTDLRFVWVPWAVSDDGRGVPLVGA